MSENEEAQEVEEQPFAKWWLCATVMGRPNVIEIVSINGNALDNENEFHPEFGPDDDIVVDHGICLMTVQGPMGQGQAFVELRQQFGPLFMPQDGDFSVKANRRPVNFKGRSLMIGPYIWLNFNDMGEAFLQEQVKGVYTPPDQLPESKPIIAGPDGRPLNYPGALGALGTFGQPG